MKPECIPQWAKERLEELNENERNCEKDVGKGSSGQRPDRGDVR